VINSVKEILHFSESYGLGIVGLGIAIFCRVYRSMVDVDRTADKANTDVDAADRDTAGSGLDAIDAIAKCC